MQKYKNFLTKSSSETRFDFEGFVSESPDSWKVISNFWFHCSYVESLFFQSSLQLKCLSNSSTWDGSMLASRVLKSFQMLYSLTKASTKNWIDLHLSWTNFLQTFFCPGSIRLLMCLSVLLLIWQVLTKVSFRSIESHPLLRQTQACSISEKIQRWFVWKDSTDTKTHWQRAWTPSSVQSQNHGCCRNCRFSNQDTIVLARTGYISRNDSNVLENVRICPAYLTCSDSF